MGHARFSVITIQINSNQIKHQAHTDILITSLQNSRIAVNDLGKRKFKITTRKTTVKIHSKLKSDPQTMSPINYVIFLDEIAPE
jgi:hypothetical protein